LVWGQRFLQAALLLPLYRRDRPSAARGLPVRFEEVPPVRKPGKKAGPEQWAAYRRAHKAHNLSTAFVAMVRELRADLDAQGFEARRLLAVGDGSFCNQTTFRQAFERTTLICRARKDLRLCFRAPEAGPRYYGQTTFSPQELYEDDAAHPWKEARIFHGGRCRRVRSKEVRHVLWRHGGQRRLLRLFVLAPTRYRTTKACYYYRQKAYLLCDDNETAATALLQAYFDRWEIEVNHRDSEEHLGGGPGASVVEVKRAAAAGATGGQLQPAIVERAAGLRSPPYRALRPLAQVAPGGAAALLPRPD
jgi:hypothetical protein